MGTTNGRNERGYNETGAEKQKTRQWAGLLCDGYRTIDIDDFAGSVGCGGRI
nr:hypothetical protein [uncultured Cupriavidus sp.]